MSQFFEYYQKQKYKMPSITERTAGGSRGSLGLIRSILHLKSEGYSMCDFITNTNVDDIIYDSAVLHMHSILLC